VNRLDLQPNKQVAGLPGLMDEITEGGSKHKTRGALQGVKDTAQEVMASVRNDDDEDDDTGDEHSDEGRPRKRATASRSRRTTSSRER
jgi:hypothetical protein